LGWEFNDSLVTIPKIKDAVVITNPPYLSKNSAKRSNSKSYAYFKDNNYADLYQLAISNVLQNFDHAIFIIPETYLNSKFFKEYLKQITIIEQNPFKDTECPICVACFSKNKKTFMDVEIDFDIFKGDLFLFSKSELDIRLEKYKSKSGNDMIFNTPKGSLGLRGVDGTSDDNRIRFCLPKDLGYDINNIKQSSRAITLIEIDYKIDVFFIERANNLLEDYRLKTHDVLLAPFKNNNKQGKRRRRLDFKLARQLLNKTIETLN
jgi:hypothetical protein